MATVNFWDGMDKATEITGADKMMIGKNATGEAQYTDFELANQFISVQGIEMKAVPPGALPAGPEGQTRKMELREAGTWTYGGNTFTNPEGYVTVLWWDGTTWSLGSSVALPIIEGKTTLNPEGTDVANEKATAEYIASTQQKLLSGDQVYSVLNYYDKSNTEFEGFYIDTTTGALVANANSLTSNWIDITGWTEGVLSGRNSGSYNNVRFKDATGNILKPVDVNGTPLPNFNLGYQNGVVYIPATAIAIQLGVKYNGTGVLDRVQFEKGSIRHDYIPFGRGIIKESALLKNTLQVTISGTDIYVRSSFNSLLDIFVRLNKTTSNNQIYNIYTEKLIGKNDLLTANGRVLRENITDDAAPMKINGTYIGANHGTQNTWFVTMNGHGKTLADVASVWKDQQGQDFILTKIQDANRVQVISTNRGGENNWDFKAGVTGNLTHVSGAANTATIVNGGITATQLLPAVKNIVHQFVLDGNVISGDGEYYGENLDIIETYDIVDVPDMLTKLVANKPVGGYPVQPDFTNGDAIVSIRNNYNIGEKSRIKLYWQFIVRKACTFEYFGGTQVFYQKPSWSTGFTRMYPNSLPISDGTTSWDFRTPKNIDTALYAAEMNLTNSYWESPSLPVFRTIDSLYGASNVNMNVGFIPILSQENRIDQVNNAWFLYPSKKQYPFAIDRKIGTVLPVNTQRSGLAFRGWSDRVSGRFNEYIVEHGDIAYIFLDYTSAVLDKYNLPQKYIGKNITIFDKSSNVSVLTEVIFDSVELNVATNTPMFGRLVLMVNLK